MNRPGARAAWGHALTGGPPIDDTEQLSNGVRVLRCGGLRDAIRAPYPLGLRAYAYLRWSRTPIGDVLAEKDKHVYFMVPPGSATVCVAPLRLLGSGAIIVLPPDGGAPTRWLRERAGPHCTGAEHVMLALEQARRRLAARPADG